jgi:hypothetical protein
VRPPKLAIRMAAGGIAVAAALALGVAGASAQTPAQLAPNPGVGYYGSLLGTPYGATGADDVYPSTDYSTTGSLDDGPQTANVPTLAWAGEAVKLVACDTYITPGAGAISNLQTALTQTAVFSTENWTGDQADADIPTLDGANAYLPLSFQNGSAGFSNPTDLPENAGKGCVQATIKSTHSGLWQGKLNVYNSANDTSNTVFSEQFIVIWMNPLTPVITESSVNSLSYPGGSTVDQLSAIPGVGNVTGGQCVDGEAIVYGPTGPPQGGDPSGLPLSGPWNCFGYLGDPSGNGMFNPSLWPICAKGTDQCVADVSVGAGPAPGNNNGLIDIRVTGTFPVEDLGVATSNEKFFGSIDGGTNPGLITLAGAVAGAGGSAGRLVDAGLEPGQRPEPVGHPWRADQPGHASGVPGLRPIWATVPGRHVRRGVHDGRCDPVAGCGQQLPWQRPVLLARLWRRDERQHRSGRRRGLPVRYPGIEPGPTVGPYDDEAPNETLLSDGRLNADDAPMPALPVTVSIAKNLGGTDLGGVGGLYSADKELIYSHNFDANKSTLGNLYNPYYYEYIPSTDRGYNESSGITGIAGDDFPGFDLLNQQPYKFWTALDPSSNNGGNTDTICLRRSDGGSNSQSDGGPEYYGEPDTYQADSVIVYTDERGEAFVDYNPGDGFYLDNLIQPDPPSSIKGGNDTGGPVVIGDNGSCDLQKLLGKEIGYSAITASAQYPYQGVDYSNPPASSLAHQGRELAVEQDADRLPELSRAATPAISSQPRLTSTVSRSRGEVVCFSVQSDAERRVHRPDHGHQQRDPEQRRHDRRRHRW